MAKRGLEANPGVMIAMGVLALFSARLLYWFIKKINPAR
jgi:hypothetical protein